MRAVYPIAEDFAEGADGMRLFYEVYGSGERTVLLLPSWQIVTSRVYKGQIPYLGRDLRVVIFDPRGTGRSDRPTTGYDHDTAAADALAVMGATDIDRAALLGVPRASWAAIILAAECRGQVERMVLLGAALEESGPGPEFFRPRERYDGWEKRNDHLWREDYRGWLEFFFDQAFPEPHSTKQIEDCINWGLETTPEIVIATTEQAVCRTLFDDLLALVACPLLLIHGAEDRIRPVAFSEHAHAMVPGSALHVLDGCGHAPQVRDPVRVNRLLREFLTRDERREWRDESNRSASLSSLHSPHSSRPPRWCRAMTRPKRARFISSPIGLGHVQRDLAIANALRELHPDLEIDWLAQEPVTQEPAAASGSTRPVATSPRRPPTSRPKRRKLTGRGARPPRLLRLARDGRSSVGQLHGLPRPGRVRALRPLARRRGLGRRLLPT